MGLFDFLGKSKSWDEKNAYHGDTGKCPDCGASMSKKYTFSEEICLNCHSYLNVEDDDDDDSETLSVYDAALIWASNGKDEDYTFGFSEEELEEALR